MKQFLSILFLCCFSLMKAQSPAYDSTLAKRLGADDYGMKSYVLVLLKTGPYKAKDKNETDSLFRGHMVNIGRLADEGKLVVAGPFGKNELYRGVFIFDVKTVEEARALCASDPAVKAGIFTLDILPWYSSAALMDINRVHKIISKKDH